MKKTLFVILVLAVAVALMAAAPSFTKLARLTVWNRTGSDVKIQLTYTGATPSESLHYYLTVKSSDTPALFTVERKKFALKYWACGGSASGTLDMLSATKLTFTDCDYAYTSKTYTKVSVAPDGLITNFVRLAADGLWYPCTAADINNAAIRCIPDRTHLWWLYKYTNTVVIDGDSGKVIHWSNYMNPGEPTFEKVHLKVLRRAPTHKSPWGAPWRLVY